MELLIAGILSCADGKWILDGIYDADVEPLVRAELALTVIESMPRDCPAGAYLPETRLVPQSKS